MKASNFIEHNEYVVRVMAVNKYGQGEPKESEPFKAENQFTVPGKPSAPDVTNVTKDSCVATWERPKSDGGSEITNFILQKRDRHDFTDFLT